MKSKNITLMALLLAVLIVCSQLSIPIQPVPITLQTFAILVIGMTVKPSQAFFITSTYALMGLIGIPVFTGYKGGFQSLTSPTFGFIISFIVASTLIAYLVRLLGRKTSTYILAGFIGTVVVYLIGLPYLGFVLNQIMNLEKSLSDILQIGMVPFLFGDVLKVLLAALVAKSLEHRLSRL